MFLSVLVISRTASNLSRLLKALEKNSVGVDYEVICSWNGSPADVETIEVPASIRFRLIDQRPYNFARNNNGIAKKALGKYVLFINDDVIPDKGAISAALSAIRRPGVGIVGINLRYQDERLQHAGVFFKEDGTPFHRLKHIVRWDDRQVSADMFVPCVTGAFILMRRDEFSQLLFDEEFEVCGEDIALNLSYRDRFDREIFYCANATALHVENETRKQTGETKTPPNDMARILAYSRRTKNDVALTVVRKPKVRIITEKPGWIMFRKAEEIQKSFGAENVRINEEFDEAEINYYINYGYYNKKPENGLTIANFTHYDPDHLAEKFKEVAHEVDHCIAVSELTADKLRELKVPENKISVIPVGADAHFRPLLTLGVVGRVYSGSRKGDDIVRALLEDEEVASWARIVASRDGWGAPVWTFEDQADFYRAIDYLLVPSRIEGGPVPYMEALACGTMSIAPEIGVVPQFPHVSYPTGDVKALKATIIELAKAHFLQRSFLTEKIKHLNWDAWSVNHEKTFRDIIC